MADMTKSKGGLYLCHTFKCVYCDGSVVMPNAPAYCPKCGKATETIKDKSRNSVFKALGIPLITVASAQLN